MRTGCRCRQQSFIQSRRSNFLWFPREGRMATLPSFSILRQHYPDQDPDTVKQTIGGKVNADWITNTCAVRMSRALNYSGIAIPTDAQGLHVISGADAKWYSYRMQELEHWLG